jgi:hypothetical protein
MPTEKEMNMTQATKDIIQTTVDAWLVEEDKFSRGNKAAGTRARGCLNELAKLAKVRRAEIQDAKNAAKGD